MQTIKSGLESLKKTIESFCLIGSASIEAKEQLCLGIDKLLDSNSFLEEALCRCEESERKPFKASYGSNQCSNCWKPIIEKQTT